jgi:hypothetical protein
MMERTKKLFIGLTCFLLVMCIGISFSYGKENKLPAPNDPSVRSAPYDYVFTGTGDFSENHLPGTQGKFFYVGTLTRVTIGLSHYKGNFWETFIEFQRSDEQVHAYSFYSILRGSKLYFNANLSLSPQDTNVITGNLNYTGQMEFTLNVNTFNANQAIGSVFTGVCSLQ